MDPLRLAAALIGLGAMGLAQSAPGVPTTHTPQLGDLGEAARIVMRYRPRVSPFLAGQLVTVARNVGADPMHLAELIHFESGGSWSPTVRHPSGEAVGLIQYRARTVERLAEAVHAAIARDQLVDFPGLDRLDQGIAAGRPLDGMARLSASEQLAWTWLYLWLVRAGSWAGPAGPLDTRQRLFLAVFHPASRELAPDALFPADVRAGNPLTPTPGDYVRTAIAFSPPA